MIKNCSRECKKNRTPISTQKYKYEGVMDEYVLDLTLKILNQKKGMITTENNDVFGNFVVKLCVMKTRKLFIINNYL